MMQTVEIRNQSDMNRLYGGVKQDFQGIRWEGWMQTQFRRMEELHASYFYGQQGPDGAAWKPNAPATIKKKGHGVILVHKYKLLPSMTRPFAEGAIRMTIDEWPKATMIFGNDIPYSVLNNNGTKRIPARPHIGLTRPFFETLTKSAVDYAFEKLRTT